MGNEKILVVDDETANLQKLRRTLVNRYTVLTAESGKEALAVIENNQDISVIIADQRMPGMTGIEFLRRTLPVLPQAIRIILTGYTDVDVLMEAINSCKVYRYIVKPWDPPDLLMTIERGLEAYRLALENAMFRKELIRRERLARELEIARDIQRYILPSDLPSLEGYEVAVEYHPALEVGGDLYDFDWDPVSGILQMVIGDVSGKSIPAALYGAVFSGQLRAVFAQHLSPAGVLSFVNHTLLERYAANNYIAVACLRLEPLRGTGSVANGGMPLPYVLNAGEVTRIAATGVPLGLMEDTIYEEVPFRMQMGDTIVLASDGVADAVDTEGRMYDESRFLESLRRHSSDSLSVLADGLYRDISGFAANAAMHDDITILALRRRLQG